MRTPLLPFLSPLAFVIVAACAAGPANEPVPQWAPMPLGEIALPMPRPVETTHPFEIEHRWTDAKGRAWNIAFRCKYASDDQHELLANACLQTNLVAAHESTLAICRDADLDTIDGIATCEERLQQNLTDVLFPCITSTSIGRVSGIEWTLWLVR